MKVTNWIFLTLISFLLHFAANALAETPTPCPVQTENGGDSLYTPTPFSPQLSSKKPKMLFEEAHYNFYSVSALKPYLPGKFKPFAQLANAEGFSVATTQNRLDNLNYLKGFDVIVSAGASAIPIESWVSDRNDANPNVFQWNPRVGEPAFTTSEINALVAYVRGGGNLLILANHAPLADPYRALLGKFGVDIRDSTIVAGIGGASSYPVTTSHPIGASAQPFRSGGGGAIHADVGRSISSYPRSFVGYGETLFNFMEIGSYSNYRITMETLPILYVINTATDLRWSGGGGRIAIGAHAGDFTSKADYCNGVRIPSVPGEVREDMLVQNQNVVLNTLRWLIGR